MTVPRSNPKGCTEIGPHCTIEGTLYGYYPSLAANSFFVAFFGLCFFIQVGLGIKYKTWTYMIALCLGCIGKVIGYTGRLILYNDPFSQIGFQIQICCLIISPAFLSAGIYLTLKHIVMTFGESWSRLGPAWYTYIFITGDLFSLVLQGTGGGIAATAEPGSNMQHIGTDLMIAGVVFQVVILSVFGYFLVEYAIRTYHRRDQLSSESMALYRQKTFRAFMAAIIIGYTGIFVRCVYRIPELTSGWRSELMRHQSDFIALEGVMIVMSVLVLTICHPGYCFPELGNTVGKKNTAPRSKSLEEPDVEMMSTR